MVNVGKRSRVRGAELDAPRPDERTPEMASRERAYRGLQLVIVTVAVVVFGLGAVAAIAEFRVPVELLVLPGLASLVAIVACRAPARRDRKLDELIAFGALLTAITGTAGLIGWRGPVQITFWALALTIALTTWLLQRRWRSR